MTHAAPVLYTPRVVTVANALAKQHPHLTRYQVRKLAYEAIQGGPGHVTFIPPRPNRLWTWLTNSDPCPACSVIKGFAFALPFWLALWMWVFWP
jgi:hypothetical protein